MPKTRIYLAAVLAVFLFITGAILVSALSEADIVYPAKELNNCKDKKACLAYCDDPANIKVCVDFAEKYDLMSKSDADQARRFIKAGSKGPGGCNSKNSCEDYCNDIEHINECLAFAEKAGLMDPAELAEAKKVQQALAKGAKLPGGCRNKNACENYCQTADHIEECVSFAEAAGFMPPEELEEAKKYMAALKSGVKPLPCRGKSECEDYCQEPDNFKGCIEFAEAAGFISPEEAEMARKTGGKGPGNCRGKNECEKYCEDDNNFAVCVDFAIEHDLISPEDAEMARKTGGKGPGGCKGREGCDSFCKNPANQKTCFNFAKEHDLLKPEDLERIEEGKEQILDSYESAPPEVQDCINQKLGAGFIEDIKSGAAMPDESVGNVMKECFTTMMQQMGPGGFGGDKGSVDDFDEDGFQFPEEGQSIQTPTGTVDTSPGVACTNPTHPGYNRPDCQLYRTYNQGGSGQTIPTPTGPVNTSPEVACTNPSHPGYNRPDCQLYRTLPGNKLPRNNLDRFLNGMVGLFFLR